MSHIRVQKSCVPVFELDALAAACEKLDCVMDLEKKRFKWYEGFNSCDGVIRRKNPRSGEYQVGLHFNQKNEVEFLFDTDNVGYSISGGGPGRWITDTLSHNKVETGVLDKLQEHFQAEVFTALHEEAGYTVEQSYYENNELVVEAYMP